MSVAGEKDEPLVCDWGARALFAVAEIQCWRLANEKIICKYPNDDQVERLRVHYLAELLRVDADVGRLQSSRGHCRECAQEAVGDSCVLRQALHLGCQGAEIKSNGNLSIRPLCGNG